MKCDVPLIAKLLWKVSMKLLEPCKNVLKLHIIFHEFVETETKKIQVNVGHYGIHLQILSV